MNKSEFRGFKQVFMFEFMTGVKKPAFVWFLIIICCIAFLSTPLMLIIGNSQSDDEASSDVPQKSVIETVYVYNETGLSIDHNNLKSSEKYSEVSFVTDNSGSYDDAVESLKSNSGSKDLVLKEEYDEKKGFEITIVSSGKSGIKDGVIKSFKEDYTEFFREETLGNLNVSSEDYDYMSKDINIAIMEEKKDGSFTADEGSISATDYTVLLGGLMILFLFINMSAGNVSTSIATEKSSRVIEYLLTGTRPMALLSGKIAARLVETVITAVASFSSYYLSQVVCLFFTVDRTAAASSSDNVVMVSSVWETITLPKLSIAIVYFLLGLALFSILGALAGASVSKLDELQDAYKLFTFIMIFSVYADMFLIIMMLSANASDAMRNFFTIFPFTGAFLTPALILTGKISTLTGIIALIVMIIAAGLMFVLAGAIYESMLLFQGKRLQIKDIIALMKKQVVE